MTLLYLHGFRSSPNSDKAVAVVDYCAAHQLPAPIVPQLPLSPLEAITLCEQLIAEHAITAVCGSSLGGFYALYLAEKFGLRCALINPAITPWVDLERDDNHARYNIDELDTDHSHYVDELKPYYTAQFTQLDQYLLLVGTADEVLDAQQSIRHLAGARQIVVKGADHNITDFGGHLDAVMCFVSGMD
ncbi:MAG: hypothetical protein H6R05_1175 [Burkholderiaceae bacterium]|nr:hypothetical protein [Burkholderiaceae bacterium]